MQLPSQVTPPILASRPSRTTRDAVVELVNRIIRAGQARGPISRSGRSALCPAAQPYQDLIDRLMFAMAGLTDAESATLAARLARML